MVKEIFILKWGMKTNFKCFFLIFLDSWWNLKHKTWWQLEIQGIKNALQHEAVVSRRGHCVLVTVFCIPKDLYLLLKGWWHSWFLPNTFWSQPVHFILKPGSFTSFTFRRIREFLTFKKLLQVWISSTFPCQCSVKFCSLGPLRQT